jgi:hypothetical protein
MKHFDEEVRRLHKNHWHTYPKTPKMNAHVERFNRTIQEEFIDYHQDLLLDPDQFNRQLIPWLIWYNAERPHWALKLDSPVQFLLKTKSRSVQFMVAQYTRLTLTPRPDQNDPAHDPARDGFLGLPRAFLRAECSRSAVPLGR